MRQYYYLIASLPMLEFGMKMPFSYDYFLTLCQEQLNRQDMALIKRASISPSEEIEDSFLTLREWKRFDITLRNEIAKNRARKFAKDPAQYLRGEYSDPFIVSYVQWVTTLDSPLEAERSLDQARWEKIEELGKWHYFDIDYLVTYALKLQILERWERMDSEKGMEILEQLLVRS